MEPEELIKHNELIKTLSYEQRRDRMIKESKESSISPMKLQGKWKCSLGGNRDGNNHLRIKIWNELTHSVLTEGADKYITELMKLEGSAFLKYYTIILSFMKPHAPQEINLNVSNVIRVEFEDREELIEGKIIEEDD